MLPVADVSTWVVPIVAGLAGVVAGLLGARATRFAARETTRAGSIDTFTTYSWTKRAMYSEFLAAAATLRAGSQGQDERSEYFRRRDQILLVTDSEAWNAVVRIGDNPADTPDSDWLDLVATLREDIGKKGKAELKRTDGGRYGT